MFCSNCGKKLSNEDRFCSSCGKNIEVIEVKEQGIENHSPENTTKIVPTNNNVNNDSIPLERESSSLRKEYFKGLIITTIIFGLLEVLLVFLVPFGELHLKVLGTIGLIVLFGLIGLLLIGLYENSVQSKWPSIGLGVNVGVFVLSTLMTWDFLTNDFFGRTIWVLIITLIGLITISSLYIISSSNKYINYSRNITNASIITCITLLSLGIYIEELYEVAIFVRSIWATSILIALGLFITLLLCKMFPVITENSKVKKKSKNKIVYSIIFMIIFGGPVISLLVNLGYLIFYEYNLTKDNNDYCHDSPVSLNEKMLDNSMYNITYNDGNNLELHGEKFKSGIIIYEYQNYELTLNTSGCSTVDGTVIFDSSSNNTNEFMSFIITKSGPKGTKNEYLRIQHGKPHKFSFDIADVDTLTIKKTNISGSGKVVFGNVYFS